mmetsp:Transcript_9776/g.28319  ORF Transcript_9776/g.28319 Transcript_9776/m.28319 type:complete len:301 (+) Transcript_9776:216-1118(+)
MLGVARGIIFVLNLLPRHSALGRYAPLALASVVAALRLIYFRGEGAHIGFRSFTYIRKFIYYACFGDRNYQQVVHNLPLVLLGYALPTRWLREHLSQSPPRSAVLILSAITFVADPLIFGIFPKASTRRTEEPLLTYLRAALRGAALCSLLPRRRTVFTEAGRSQLLAYLFHDALFSFGFFFIALGTSGHTELPGHPKGWKTLVHSSWAVANSSVIGALGAFFSSIAVLAAYLTLCISVQVALSRPRAAVETVSSAARCASRVIGVLYARARLAILALARRCWGYNPKYTLLPSTEQQRV